MSVYASAPDMFGFYGNYGGIYVSETLMPAVRELEIAFNNYRSDPAFIAEYDVLMRDYVGRPSPVTYAERLSDRFGGARIYLKREDLNHTGAHKINNCVGQILLAKRMGKRRIIAETGAGQHGVATATVAALVGLECEIYMGAVDIERQKLNVFKMTLLGARVRSVVSGSRTLKDAINEALRDWVSNVESTYYLLGSVLGPHPYPLIVREFQSIIGKEARAQMLEKTGRLPDCLVACVGGGSNAIGLFHAFLADPDVRMIGVEAGGTALEPGCHAARFSGGSPGVLQGTKTFVLQNGDGQIMPTHSISAGLDYAAVGPEHAMLRELGRVEYVSVSDAECLAAFKVLAETEGIVPALESAHAVAHALRLAPQMSPEQSILINLSGRGDKDVQTVAGQTGVVL